MKIRFIVDSTVNGNEIDMWVSTKVVDTDRPVPRTGEYIDDTRTFRVKGVYHHSYREGNEMADITIRLCEDIYKCQEDLDAVMVTMGHCGWDTAKVLAIKADGLNKNTQENERLANEEWALHFGWTGAPSEEEIDKINDAVVEWAEKNNLHVLGYIGPVVEEK